MYGFHKGMQPMTQALALSDGADECRSERCVSHRLPRLPPVGVQARQRQLQKRGPRGVAGNQEARIEARAHP